jgi:hypothetical protein
LEAQDQARHLHAGAAGERRERASEEDRADYRLAASLRRASQPPLQRGYQPTGPSRALRVPPPPGRSYALVDFDSVGFGPATSATYIAPSSAVADVLTKSYEAWLKTTGRGGHIHKGTDLRLLVPRFRGFTVPDYPDGWLESYREQWERLRRGLIDAFDGTAARSTGCDANCTAVKPGPQGSPNRMPGSALRGRPYTLVHSGSHQSIGAVNGAKIPL